MKSAQFIVEQIHCLEFSLKAHLQQRVLWLLQDWLVVRTSASTILPLEEYKHPRHSITHYNKVTPWSMTQTVGGYQL